LIITTVLARALRKAGAVAVGTLPLRSVSAIGAIILWFSRAIPAGGTGVDGAGILVIAVFGLASADSQGTNVIYRARIFIVTSGFVQHELASQAGSTRVVRTRVSIVTSQVDPTRAFSQVAMVQEGTDISVVAGSLIHCVYASLGRVTTIVGANITVTADLRTIKDTDPHLTMIPQGASIPIVTGFINRFVGASKGRVAIVRGARVVVVAVEVGSGSALAVCAGVVNRADAAVGAGSLVGRMLATINGIAGIIRTRVVVRAVDLDAGGAGTFYALVASRAGVDVVAGKALVGRDDLALPGFGNAMSLLADRIGSFFRWAALDDGFGINFALVGELVSIADKGPVADVAVFEVGAIFVGLAVAREFGPHAFGFLALVSNGTRIPVVAGVVVGGEHAAACVITAVIRARIVVLALHGGSDAYVLHAVVRHGAGITIHALPTVRGEVLAALFGFALILGASVVVIAEVAILALNKGRFIGLIVAIVIEAITCLFGRHGGIAVGEPFLLAHPFAGAGSPVVAVLAGCPQGQVHRLVGTGTDPGVVDALLRVDVVDRHHILT